jgi:hypothetical protein
VNELLKPPTELELAELLNHQSAVGRMILRRLATQRDMLRERVSLLENDLFEAAEVIHGEFCGCPDYTDCATPCLDARRHLSCEGGSK